MSKNCVLHVSVTLYFQQCCYFINFIHRILDNCDALVVRFFDNHMLICFLLLFFFLNQIYSIYVAATLLCHLQPLDVSVRRSLDIFSNVPTICTINSSNKHRTVDITFYY